MSASSFKNLIFAVVLFALVAQATASWFIIFGQRNQLSQVAQSVKVLDEKIDTLSQKTQPEVSASASSDLRTEYNEALSKIASMSARLTALETKSSQKVVTQSKTSKTSPTAKEYFLFLGSGETRSQEWGDIPSASVIIDAKKYGKITDVRFEGSLSIVGGEAQARLVNKTTGYTYFESGIFHNTPTVTWKTSNSLQLYDGVSEYMVQMRATSGEAAVLSGARVRIVVE